MLEELWKSAYLHKWKNFVSHQLSSHFTYQRTYVNGTLDRAGYLSPTISETRVAF